MNNRVPPPPDLAQPPMFGAPPPGREERAGPREFDMRPYVRPDDSDRVRMRNGNEAINPFKIPQWVYDRYPDLSFEWKAYEVMGQPNQAENQMIHDQGWRPVPHQMVPGVYAEPGTPGPVIVRDMILVERPAHLTKQAREEEIGRARSNVMINRENAAISQDPRYPRTKPVFSEEGIVEIPND